MSHRPSPPTPPRSAAATVAQPLHTFCCEPGCCEIGERGLDGDHLAPPAAGRPGRAARHALDPLAAACCEPPCCA